MMWIKNRNDDDPKDDDNDNDNDKNNWKKVNKKKVL